MISIFHATSYIQALIVQSALMAQQDAPHDDVVPHQNHPPNGFGLLNLQGEEFCGVNMDNLESIVYTRTKKRAFQFNNAIDKVVDTTQTMVKEDDKGKAIAQSSMPPTQQINVLQRNMLIVSKG